MLLQRQSVALSGCNTCDRNCFRSDDSSAETQHLLIILHYKDDEGLVKQP